MKNLLTFIFSVVVFSVSAQSKKEWGIEYRQKIGFLAAHRGIMGHLPQGHAFAGELSLFFRPKGRKEWHAACGFPYTGLTLFGGSVGNNQVLGRYWGSYAFIEFPLIRSKHYEFLWKLGSGLGYASKVYGVSSDPKNVAMSSHVNAMVCTAFKSNFIFKQNKISLSLDMTHFSNAATKMPNLGINLPYVSLGYSRTIHKAQLDSIKVSQILPMRKWLFGATFIGSWKEVLPTGGKKYPVIALSTGFRWFAKPKVGCEFALDIISKQAIFGYKPEVRKTQWDILQLGLFAGYLVPLDQFHFVIGMGVYVKDKYQPEDRVYHRVGMRYYFKNGVNAHLILKSHWAKADYAEFGVGYTFNFNRK